MLSDKYADRIQTTFAKYPDKRSAVMSMLYIAQEEYGWVTPESIVEVAEICELDPTQVKSIAGFYTMAFIGMAPLGNIAAGAIAGVVGVQATFAANGLVAAVASLWFWRQLPTLRELMRPTYVRLGIIAGET